MTMNERVKLSKRDVERLKALENADKALYELWRKSEINSPETHAINGLQLGFIHPAIRALKQARRPR